MGIKDRILLCTSSVEEKYVSKLPFPNEQQMLKVFQVTKFKRHTSRLTTWGRELDAPTIL